eukprot:scpid86747/ scgid21379/ NADH dehydrogenase [ubiquinone] iron-sulfur protein 6, mitochondrial; Complex I-13kD-A; NADH-ubiquinone oxidoreductase 13 kDa-A subunit
MASLQRILRAQPLRLALVCQRSCSDSALKVTHTGQVWEADDFRNIRFIGRYKQVNPNFANELIAQVPPKEVEDRVVYCDGGDPSIGHPKVYLNLDQSGPHSCTYCGLRFVLKKEH